MSGDNPKFVFRADTGVAEPLTMPQWAGPIQHQRHHAPVVRIRIPNLANMADSLPAEQETTAHDAAQQCEEASPTVGHEVITQPAILPRSSRQRSIWLQPQMVLAGVVIVFAVLLGVVVFRLKDASEPTERSGDSVNNAIIGQEATNDDVPRATLHSVLLPVAFDEGDQSSPPRSRHVAGYGTTRDDAGDLWTNRPNRPARLGNGPLANMQPAELSTPTPNTGETIGVADHSRGVASLKGYLQNHLTAEAGNERDRPGLR